jgi:dTMP kinase
MGYFIVFEGIEGCGKTTQLSLLGEYLKKKGLPVIITREPGGTFIGDEIRKILLSTKNADIAPETELLLYTASRVQHLQQLITPALSAGTTVLCDRFFDATVAYQGYGEGLDLALIRQMQKTFFSYIIPDLTILLDCPVDLGLGRSRRRIRSEGKESAEGRFEEKEIIFHARVRSGYLELARMEPKRFCIINGEQEVAAVHQEICTAVEQRLREKGYAI